MQKNTMIKWLFLALLFCLSVWSVTPPSKKVRFGLDIEGGAAFRVKVDEEKLKAEIDADPVMDATDKENEFEKRMDGIGRRTLEVLRGRIDALGIDEPIVELGRNDTILVQIPGSTDEERKAARTTITGAAYLEFRLVHARNDELVTRLFSENMIPEGYEATRVKGRQVLMRTKAYGDIVEEDADAYYEKLSRIGAPSVFYELMLQKEILPTSRENYYIPVYVERVVRMDGSFVASARIVLNSFNKPWVGISFDSEGTEAFSELTRKFSKNERQLAIVLDGVLKSAPILKTPIDNGEAVIEGQFTTDEATRLVNVLKAGSLPVPVKIDSEYSVNPSLGKDSMNSGVTAIMVGGAAVVLFMLIYYRFCGVVANLALLLDMLLLPFGMLMAGGLLGVFSGDSTTGGVGALPVLTLPGIAGILLTIGMAVDANVLIFERIREELKTGKRLMSAIEAGYDRAYVTIIDANITTLLTAVVLFIFGSGPVRGFAVTLCAGIFVSLITALMFTRLFFRAVIPEGSKKVLTMMAILKEKTHIDFVSKRKVAAGFSVIVIVVTWAIFAVRANQTPDKVFGVDFMGGAAVEVNFDQSISEEALSMGKVKAALGADEALRGSRPQFQQELDGVRFLRVKVPSAAELTAAEDGEAESLTATVSEDAAGAVVDALQKGLPDADWRIRQIETVSPEVGSRMKSDAVKAIVIALFIIVLYVSVRFEFGFAVGAIAALAHDVLFTTGVYCLFGRQISLPIVAALLTIVGYSVNDTIVVFDRIREDLKLEKKMSFLDICNLSINQTLSRTLLTSVTTLLAVTSLVVLGGGAIFDFALTLLIGIVVGTYSSIFVATPVVLLFYRDKKPGFATKKQ